MIYGLLFTILTGLFFLIGIVFLNNVHKKDEISLFTSSLSFVVMLGLIFFDLLPELLETKNILFLLPLIGGFFLLVFLDKLIPHHHHEHHEINDDKKDHELHLAHISIITIMALIIHNLLEGLTLYTVTLNNILSGLLMMISISLHNIPLGFQIGNSLKKDKLNYGLITILCCSSLLGALIVIIFGSLNSLVENILLSITIGMLAYILIFELLGEILTSLKKKSTLYGIIIGVVVLIITILL